MNVDHSAVIPGHEIRAENAHESCQCNDIRSEGIYGPCQRGIEAVAIRIVAVFDDGDGDAVCFGNVQAFGIRAIADHRSDAAGQCCFQQGLHVAAPAGYQDDDIFHL